MTEDIFTFRGGKFSRADGPFIMGILNVTPDSFSDGGKFFDPAAAAQRAFEMAGDGADIIDIGAVSTRPGSAPVSEQEEKRRLLPVLREVIPALTVPVSVDTFRPGVAREALELGAAVINDVSGLVSPAMGEVVRDSGAGWVIMHSLGAMRAGQNDSYPDGVSAAVSSFFDRALALADSYGIDRSHILLDPGFGFSKAADDDLTLLRSLANVKKSGCLLLAALSRKRFIGALSNEPSPAARLPGTLAADIMAVERGADMVRVHDVKAHRQAFDLMRAVLGEQNG